jgi:uncharacterized membrane protein
MWVMAVHTAHTCVVHAAGVEGTILVVLIPNLTVWIEGVGMVHDGEMMVIEEPLSRFEITR